jgi:hypothetical protein
MKSKLLVRISQKTAQKNIFPCCNQSKGQKQHVAEDGILQEK